MYVNLAGETFSYVYRSFASFVPTRLVTSTLALPSVPDGVTAVIVFSSVTVKLFTAAPPMVTAVAPVKLLPVMVTTMLPDMLPVDGLISATVGGAT